MTLVELLLAMVIGLGVTLAVSTLLVAAENHKRTTTSTNDAEQTGAYVYYALDKALRGAGSAISESAFPTGVLGCRLNAGSFLPRTTAFPAPFSTAFLGGAPSSLRVAPILIGAGQSDNTSSDVLVVMGGAGTAGGVARPVYGAGSSTSLVLESTVGFTANSVLVNDLVLLSQYNTTDCLLEQVSGTTATSLTLTNAAAYPYYTTGSTTTLTTLAGSTSSAVTPLGNSAANDVQFTLYGVGTNNTLYSYDLLQNQYYVGGTGTNNTSQAIADGVMQMNAIYGVATTATPGVFATWAGPLDAGYTIASVMASPATMANIICVRVAVVVRGAYADKNSVSPATLTLFSGYVNAAGASLAKTVTVPDQHYRYRVFEFTVPLRNLLLLAGA
jgi:type IV pilus assembly protein PilW